MRMPIKGFSSIRHIDVNGRDVRRDDRSVCASRSGKNPVLPNPSLTGGTNYSRPSHPPLEAFRETPLEPVL